MVAGTVDFNACKQLFFSEIQTSNQIMLQCCAPFLGFVCRACGFLVVVHSFELTEERCAQVGMSLNGDISNESRLTERDEALRKKQFLAILHKCLLVALMTGSSSY